MTSTVGKQDFMKNVLLKYLVCMDIKVIAMNLSLSSSVGNLLSKLGKIEGSASGTFLLIIWTIINIA